VACRICNHAFDCPTCAEHAAFAATERERGTATATTGIRLPDHHLFHRGHTWVARRTDGLVDIGLDDLALRCFGRPDRLVLPQVGSELQSGDQVATVVNGDSRTRIIAPIDGEVVAAGDLDEGWLCRVRPTGDELQFGHLLRGREAEVWMLRELESLQRWLSPDTAAPVLADGGTPVDDLADAYPDADWDAIRGDLCLEA
jgi:hypothetical protein